MKKGRLLIVVLFGAFVVGAYFFLFGRQGIYYQHRELVRRSAEIAHQRRAIDSLSDVIDKLTSDTVYIERIAREKLGMARKDEIVYKFIKKGKQ